MVVSDRDDQAGMSSRDFKGESRAAGGDCGWSHGLPFPVRAVCMRSMSFSSLVQQGVRMHKSLIHAWLNGDSDVKTEILSQVPVGSVECVPTASE